MGTVDWVLEVLLIGLLALTLLHALRLERALAVLRRDRGRWATPWPGSTRARGRRSRASAN